MHIFHAVNTVFGSLQLELLLIYTAILNQYTLTYSTLMAYLSWNVSEGLGWTKLLQNYVCTAIAKETVTDCRLWCWVAKCFWHLQVALDGRVDLLNTFLERCAHGRRSQLNALDKEGLAALHYAARFNRVVITRRLLEAKCSECVYHVTVYSWTLLSLAC